MDKIVNIQVRLATPDDSHLPAYDNTKLQAINTCPTWGITRYTLHKTPTSPGRAMALEAGQACHEVFAAVRLWQLIEYDFKERSPEFRLEAMQYHGARLFGKERFDGIILPHWLGNAEDDRTRCINFCLAALETSGFYDDPSDRRRTMSNLEEACLLYIERWDWKRHPIWIRDADDPCSDVGIEIAFDIVLTYTYQSGRVRSYRFIGKADGIHWRDGRIVIGENKTASRTDVAWEMSFDMSSQITGYTLAASTWTGSIVERAIVWGLVLPLPKSNPDGGITVLHPRRESHHVARWFEWFIHTVDLEESFNKNPIEAPKYTHSCNRYFRPCSLIPFCHATDEDAEVMLSEMRVDEWSPLHEVVEG